MSDRNERVRVLYSFPAPAGRGPDLLHGLAAGERPGSGGSGPPRFPGLHFEAGRAPGVRVSPTLARGSFRLPYRLVGTMRAVALHDQHCGAANRETGGAD